MTSSMWPGQEGQPRLASPGKALGRSVIFLACMSALAGCDRPTAEEAKEYGYCVGGVSSSVSALWRQHNDDKATKLEAAVQFMTSEKKMLRYMKSGADKYYWQGFRAAQRDYLLAAGEGLVETFVTAVTERCKTYFQ